jgi:phage-related minor tail protein
MAGGGAAFFNDNPVMFGAKGLAYNNGNLINNATVFGTNSGLAVGGELGTEAIMPLSRGADGRLGVTVNGAGNGNVNINFTINAVDAKGIDTMLVERKSLITNIVRSAMQDRGVRI